MLTANDEPYPTKPIDVAFEIVSDGEAIEEKCEHYTRIGIPQVFVFFGEAKEIRQWDGISKRLAVVEDVQLMNEVTITRRTIWTELDRRMNERHSIGRFICRVARDLAEPPQIRRPLSNLALVIILSESHRFFSKAHQIEIRLPRMSKPSMLLKRVVGDDLLHCLPLITSEIHARVPDQDQGCQF